MNQNLNIIEKIIVKNEIKPNYELAKDFLTKLAPNETNFSFRTFDDSGSGDKSLTRSLNGTLEEHFEKLSELNKKGAGVFFTVNKTNMVGTKDADVVGLRSLFIDFDNGKLPELKLKPTLIIKTKKGSHCYWCLIDNQKIEFFTSANKQLIKTYDSDKCIHDLSRCLRLVGFYHNKELQNPYLIKIEEFNEVRYTIAEVLEKHPLTQKNDTSNSSSTKIVKFKKWVLKQPIKEGSRNNAVLLFVREGLGRGFSYEVLLDIVNDYCQRSNLPANEGIDILDRQFKKHTEKKFEPFFEDQSSFIVENNIIYKVKKLVGDIKKIPVSSLIEVTSRTRNLENENWGYNVKWLDADGVEHHHTIPSVSLLSGDYILSLLNKGLVIFPNHSSKEYLSQYIITQKSVERMCCVSKTGWAPDANFVLPDQNIGAGINNEQIVLQNSSNLDGKSFVTKFKTQGTLEDWQDNVGKYCVNNSKLILVVSLALSTPLLEPLKKPNCGIHLFGCTSIGKTTASYVAGSVWGGEGERGFLETWRTTSNAMEGVAAIHNDSIVILDEIAEANSIEVSNIIYMLGNGRGKLRATRTGNVRDKHTWQNNFLSTGEIPFEVCITQVGIDFKGGQAVRLLDIPAESDKDYGLFENIHNEKSSGDFSKLLEKNSKRYYGTPIRSFIKKIVPVYNELQSMVTPYLEQFNSEVKKLISSDTSFEVLRTIDKFAIIAAAGELAIKLGILPWPKGTAISGVNDCLKIWLNEHGSTSRVDEEQLINNLRGYLQKYSLSRFPVIEEKTHEAELKNKPINNSGFKRCINVKSKKNEETKYQYLIYPDVFKKEICLNINHKWAIKVLHSHGYLEPDRDNKPGTRVEYISILKNRMRVYVINPSIFEG